MPKWPRKKIGEVCTLSQGLAINVKTKHYLVRKSSLPLLRIKDLKNNTVEQYIDPDNYPEKCLVNETDLIYTRTGQVGLVFTGRFGILHNNCFKISPNESLLKTYLSYVLRSDEFREKIIKLSSKTAQPDITHKIFKEQTIWIPPLPEQKRIVAILDEVFAGIDNAIANTEKNLLNVEELHQSVLQSRLSSNDSTWTKTTIGKQIKLQRGFDITKKQQKPGRVPVVSSGGIKSYHDTPMVKAPGVVIGRKGTLGKAFYIESDFWPHDTSLWVKEFNDNDPKFVYYFLKGLDVTKLDSGTANPSLNRNLVHSIELSWPSVTRQKEIVKQLDLFLEHSKRLETIYQQKLTALNELKQSILQKAFTGELTADTATQATQAAKEEIAA